MGHALPPSRNRQVRLAAVAIVEGLTGSVEGISTLRPKQDKLLPHLLRLVPEPGVASQKALHSLVNLSQEPELVAKLLELKVVGRCMDYLKDGTCGHPRLLVRGAHVRARR